MSTVRVPPTSGREPRDGPWRIIGLVTLGLLVLYVGSYYALSRYSLYVLEGPESLGFYYVPCSGDTIARNSALEALNGALVVFYYPIWAVDHCVLRGPYWAYPPLTELGR